MSFFGDMEDKITGAELLKRRTDALVNQGLAVEISEDNFVWKTKDSGVFLRPEDMETRHLFFTIRMIYNNTVPEEYRHPPVRLYKFGAFYTTEYMAMAVRALLEELSTRDDITPYFKRSLLFIRKNLNMINAERIDNGRHIDE